MRKNRILIWVLLLALFFSGIFLLSDKNAESLPDTEDGLSHYQYTMIGDNSKVSAILEALWGYHDIALKTTEKPYGLTVNYFDVEKGENIGLNFKDENERNILFLQRASSLFVLIPNLDKVTMTFDGNAVFSFSRKSLEWLLGLSFSDFEDDYTKREKTLKEKIENVDIQKGISEAFTHFPEGMMSQEYQL